MIYYQIRVDIKDRLIVADQVTIHKFTLDSNMPRDIYISMQSGSQNVATIGKFRTISISDKRFTPK